VLIILCVDGTIVDIRFSSSGDSILRTTQDAYIEFACETDQQLALNLHQKLYHGNHIKGWLLFFRVFSAISEFFCLE